MDEHGFWEAGKQALSSTESDGASKDPSDKSFPHAGSVKPHRSSQKLLKSLKRSDPDRPAFVGCSSAMMKLASDIDLFAPESEPVLIHGETGVGKEVVARELHRLGKRSNKPFVVRNISNVSPELAASEFFGHVKGAYTGAVDKRDGVFTLANGGTLHLDEIGDLPLDAQSKILRVIEDGMVTPVGGVRSSNVDVRLIAATNINLETAIASGKFREDLYHRLNVLRINVPPLRDRGDDILELAEHWLSIRRAQTGMMTILGTSAIEAMLAYPWPGNVRELKNILTRAAILAKGGEIGVEHLNLPKTMPNLNSQECFDIAQGKDLVIRLLAAQALEKVDGNASKAAKLTGLSRSTFMGLKQKLTVNNDSAEELKATLRAFLRIS